ncbi:MAG: hypothetical protein ACI8TQ_001231 [Planctomycetota bacterium]|jgi:hypothetical protein
MSQYDIRPYQDSDRDSLLACFNLVFGAGDPNFKPRSLSEWSWAFEQNPGGQRIWVAVSEGEVVAQYAGYPYRVNLDGETVTFSQILDSFAHPDHRRGLKRPGLFVQTGLEYLDATTGPGKDVVTFGWPIEEANRLGERYFQYEVVRTQLLLGRPVGDGTDNPISAGTSSHVVERILRFEDEVLDLYQRCSEEWGASVIRDAAYLNWRYIENPFFEYHCYGVRDLSGTLCGFFVQRTGDWITNDVGILMDWLVPFDDKETAGILHEAYLAVSRSGGAQSLITLFPEWCPWFSHFQGWSWKAYPSDLLTVGRQAHLWDMEYLRENWWYQLGETDLV